MSEFGHKGIIVGGMCIDSWGGGPFTLTVAGKSHRFEDSDRFGPIKVNKDGSIPNNQSWPERHPFWIAHSAWVKQGCQLEDDGRTCIWSEPEPMVSSGWDSKGLPIMIIEHGNGRIEIAADPSRPKLKLKK